MLQQNKFIAFVKLRKYFLLIFFGLLVLYISWLPKNLFADPYSTIIYDEHNELLGAHIAKDGQWRFPYSDSVPDKFKTCITFFEDEYFYRHLGVNPISLSKAFVKNSKSGKIKSGGSTITMQVARLMRKNKSRTYWEKFVEILLAFRIELSYKKNFILNTYACHAPFGSNVVGLHAASWRYFGRSPDKLSWAECALLAVLPNAPSLIYPGKNHKALLNKRNRLLKKLYDNKVIDESTYHLSLEEGIPEKAFAIPQYSPHLLARAASENGAGKIYFSTLNKNLQQQINAALNNHIQTLSSNSIYNAGALVIETETGKVIAYVGNSFSATNEHDNYVDVVEAPRSTGSILKPFLYASMLNDSKILPNMLLEDIPMQMGSYAPKNFNLTYDGLVPASMALARSLNVPAVKMLQEFGVSRFQYQLQKLGFKNFTKPASHYGLSLILGGGEATLWDIASAYASMGRTLSHYSNYMGKYDANDYHDAIYLQSEIETKKSIQKTSLLSAGSIWCTFNAMTELARPEDYASWSRFLSSNRIAWKTGTSFGFRDAWAVGVNAKYTVAVWVGNADGEGRPGLTGISAAAPLMFAVFNLLPSHAWFKIPYQDMTKTVVCKQSGYKASDVCPDKIVESVPKNATKTSLCPYHKMIHLNATGMYRVNSNCYPVAQMQHKAWFITSPVQEYYFKQHSSFYQPLPPYLPQCQTEISTHQIDIVYPRPGFKIYIPYEQSEEKGRLILKAMHKNNAATIFWHLDGKYIGSTQKFHQMEVLPAKGKHILEVIDEQGESMTCAFEIVDKESSVNK
ncbi:MAG TPA: penicillin-binding protein 1C [Bacteroidia bacterium]|nr:penicillin-binding protein 1C [Bacteroidia bacterium]